VPIYRRSGRDNGSASRRFTAMPFANNVDNAGDFRRVQRRLPGVNHNRKGLRPPQPKKHSLRIWSDQSGTHYNLLQQSRA
jgi:hypothetical protein